MTGLTVNLSGKRMTIHLSGDAKAGRDLCQNILREFLSPRGNPSAQITIERSHAPCEDIPGWPEPEKPVLEKRLPDDRVLAWVREADLFQGGFPLSDQTISSYCLGALHLFDPLTSAGHAFLLEQGPGFLKPLHRLLWMYFAQVLGQGRGCFLHGAAIAREGSGYLFLGDSGAGKSTIAGLFNKGVVLSDDSPIMSGNGSGHWLFPSPFHQLWGTDGRRWASLPSPVRMLGLFFLTKSDDNYLEEVRWKEAFSMIINRHIHFFQYLSGEARLLLFDLLHDLSRRVPAYDLHFSRHGDVWSVLRDLPGGGMK